MRERAITVAREEGSDETQAFGRQLRTDCTIDLLGLQHLAPSVSCTAEEQANTRLPAVVG